MSRVIARKAAVSYVFCHHAGMDQAELRCSSIGLSRDYFLISGGRPAEPCWPMGRSASCSKGSLVWDGGISLFLGFFAEGFFLVLLFRLRLRLTAIASPGLKAIDATHRSLTSHRIGRASKD